MGNCQVSSSINYNLTLSEIKTLFLAGHGRRLDWPRLRKQPKEKLHALMPWLYRHNMINYHETCPYVGDISQYSVDRRYIMKYLTEQYIDEVLNYGRNYVIVDLDQIELTPEQIDICLRDAIRYGSQQEFERITDKFHFLIDHRYMDLFENANKLLYLVKKDVNKYIYCDKKHYPAFQQNIHIFEYMTFYHSDLVKDAMTYIINDADFAPSGGMINRMWRQGIHISIIAELHTKTCEYLHPDLLYDIQSWKANLPMVRRKLKK